MLTDEALISIKSGKGGDGLVSFRREKFVPKGGPDGGDGGDGADVIIMADSRTSDLSQFNRQKKFLAPDGQNGMGKKMKGANGEDLALKVPLGTQIFEDGKILHDFLKDEDTVIIAKGGQGGWGNQHFATSIKQTPKWSKDGLLGESKKISLELKTIADIGLIGLPNAGKSSLLNTLTNAKSKVANYPFTTLNPNLGAYYELILADIPGLIEGASLGKGLGIKFLRHVERTKTLFHLISAESDDPVKDYQIIRQELGAYNKELLSKQEYVFLSKSDIIDKGGIKEKLSQLKKAGVAAIPISVIDDESMERVEEILRELIKQKYKN